MIDLTREESDALGCPSASLCRAYYLRAIDALGIAHENVLPHERIRIVARMATYVAERRAAERELALAQQLSLAAGRQLDAMRLYTESNGPAAPTIQQTGTRGR